MSLRIGIIGCGGIAASHVRGYKAHGAVIAAVADKNPEAAETLASEIDGPQVFQSGRELIDSCRPDAVSICTPPVAHEQDAVHALNCGVHVLCEKPMTVDAESAHRMQRAAEQSDALFMPAFRHRFLPAIVVLRNLVASGKIGEVVLFNNIFCGPAFHMEGRWFTERSVSGGGCITDTSSHSVDLFRFLVGEITQQRAVMHRHFQTTDVEDAGILDVKSESGAIGSLQSAFVAGAGAAFIDIIGTKGQVVYDYTIPGVLRCRLTDDADWTESPVQRSDGFNEEIGHFLGAVRGEHPLSCTVDDGVRVVEVIGAVYEDWPCA